MSNEYCECFCCGYSPFAPLDSLSTLSGGGWPSENVLGTLASWVQPMEGTSRRLQGGKEKRQGRKLLTPSTGLQLASGSVWGYSFNLEVPIVIAHSGFWSYSPLSPLVPSDPAVAMTSFYCWLRGGESPSLLVPLACSHFYSIFIWVSPVTTLECGCFLLGPWLIQLWSSLIEKCLFQGLFSIWGSENESLNQGWHSKYKEDTNWRGAQGGELRVQSDW